MAGKIEKAIGEIMASAEPGAYFTTTKLCELVYGVTKRKVEKKHRVAVLRAAKRFVERNPRFDLIRNWDREERILIDATDASAWFWSHHRPGWRQTKEDILERSGRDMEPGGGAWRKAEAHKAKLVGDTARIEELKAEESRKSSAQSANLKAKLAGEPSPEELANQAIGLLLRYFERTGERELDVNADGKPLMAIRLTDASE